MVWPQTHNLTSSTSTDRQYVGYVSEPPGRGTISLILSCLLTLVLCVWSALHLNVPTGGQSATKTFWLNCRWIITGIYAPELVVFTAWRQWSSARLLTQHIQQYTHTSEHSGSAHRLPTWTKVHSFFACSGGFAMEIDPDLWTSGSASMTESQRPRSLTLTARGVALLATHGFLPSVSKAEIQDKSKANNLAKTTTILQASWMLLQCLGRLAAGLPVTLLEVNTVAHVVCTLFMYLLWWSKPLLPNEAIVIRDRNLRALAAFMYASSEMSGPVGSGENVRSQTTVKTLFARMNLYSKVPQLEALTFQTFSGQGMQSQADSHCQSGIHVAYAQESCRERNRAQKRKNGTTAFFERRPRIIYEREPTATLTVKEQALFDDIAQALDLYPEILRERVMVQHKNEDTTCTHLRSEQLVADRIQNWPGDDLMRDVDGLIVGMILWLANFAYGGIHAAAWNDHFPSPIEQWFWRCSASYIGFCGGLWLVLNFLVARTPKLNEFWEHWMEGKKSWITSFGIGLIVFICGLSLVIARIFIVVEAFVSIRDLPKDAYRTPEWTSIFPHL